MFLESQEPRTKNQDKRQKTKEQRAKNKDPEYKIQDTGSRIKEPEHNTCYAGVFAIKCTGLLFE